MRYYRAHTYLLLFLFCALNSSGQANKINQNSFDPNIDVYGPSIEKVYMHFNRSRYAINDDCLYKAYVVSGPELKPSDISQVLYVDWLDQHFNLIEQHKLKIVDGHAEGKFVFSYNVPDGVYVVRAYTRWMRNQDAAYFYKQLFAISPNSSLIEYRKETSQHVSHVEFFPEGGKLVEGIPTRMAVRITNELGQGIFMKGEIQNAFGKKIGPIQTIYGGMAVFPYTPTKEKYSLKLPSGKMFSFPIAEEKGVVLNINSLRRDNISIAISSSEDNLEKEFTLRGIAANEKCYESKFVLRKSQVEFDIDKSALPAGVVHFILFDDDENRVCERMVFVNNIGKNHVKLIDSINDDSLLVMFIADQLKLRQEELNVSLSIEENSLSSSLDSKSILTYLLLASDIKTPVPEVPKLIDSIVHQNIYLVDLIMLTHEMRKSIPKLQQQIAGSESFQAETTLTLKGVVKDAYSKKIVNEGELMLVIDEAEYSGIYSVKVDLQGRFLIDSLDYGDSTLLIWQYRDKKGKLRPVNVELLDSVNIPPADTTLKWLVSQHFAQWNQLDSDSGTGRSSNSRYKQLEEVVITGRQKKVRALGPGSIIVFPDKNDMAINASQFISGYAIGLPFLQPVTRKDFSVVWVTTSGALVTLIVDGYKVDEHNTGINPYHYLMSFKGEDIEYVVITGHNRAGYIITVKTNQQSFRRPQNFVQKYARGYTSFTENVIAETAVRTKNYWNPDFKITEKFSTPLKYNGADSTIKIAVQGIGANGEIIDYSSRIHPRLSRSRD